MPNFSWLELVEGIGRVEPHCVTGTFGVRRIKVVFDPLHVAVWCRVREYYRNACARYQARLLWLRAAPESRDIPSREVRLDIPALAKTPPVSIIKCPRSG